MSVYGRDSNAELHFIGGSTNINELYSEIFDLAYPIGSIYQSTSSTNPATLFGGTWEQLKDRFLLGDGDMYTNGEIGGEINVTITTATMPAHGHSLSSCTNPGNHSHNITDYRTNIYTLDTPRKAVNQSSNATKTSSSKGSHNHTVGINNTGGGGAHNNMPPYFMVYIWKRVA